MFRLIGMPLVRRAGGWTAEPVLGTIRATLSPRPAERRRPARRRPGPARATTALAEPIFGSSALLSVLTAADGYLIVPEDANGLSAGEPVDVFPYG